MKAMKTFQQLSPVGQAVLRHLKDVDARAGDDIALTSIVSALSLRKGIRIRDTVHGVDECTRAGWTEKLQGPATAPDRITLTTAGFGMLLFMP